MATITMAQGLSSPCHLNNFSNDEDNSHFYLMERWSKVQESTTSSSLTSSSSTPSDIDDLDNEEDTEANMIIFFQKGP
jgi:hypothetical protein